MSTDTDIAQPRRLPVTISRHVVLIALALLMGYPLLWLISSSFKPEQVIFSEPGLIPDPFTLSNYIEGWNKLGMPFAAFMLNSVIICVLCIVGNLFSCTLAAYAFARLEFPFSKVAFAIMLATIMLPFHVTILPQYIVFQKLGAVNSFIPLVLPKFFAVDAFFVFLLVQFIRGIPRDLDEAAAIDGAGPIRIYWSLILPLMGPALVTTAVFSFIWTYEDFLTPLVYLTSMQLYTVPLGLRLFMASTGASAWGPMLAMSLLSLVPLFVVFFIFQRRLINGIATTGLKG